MGQTKEQKIIKALTNPQSVQLRTAIATDMYLPNHSGISSHPEFKKALAGMGVSLVAVNPVTGTDGEIILNTSDDTLYIWYLGAWRTMLTLTITAYFMLLETGDKILLETGDKIIL